MKDLTIDVIKKFFEDNKDAEAVKTYLAAMKGSSKIGKEEVESWLATDDGKKFLISKTDQSCTNAINTFKEKTMPGLIKEAVEAKIKELNPAETPEQKKLREQDDRINKLELERNKERMEKLVLQLLTNAKLPEFSLLMSLLVGDDDKTTEANVKILQELVQKEVEKKLKENLPGRETPQSSDLNMGDPNFKNPFSTKYFNLTEQGLLWRKNKELAQKLQKEAAA